MSLRNRSLEDFHIQSISKGGIKMKVFRVENLKRFVIDTLKAIGVSEDQASVVADVLVEADLRGIESHGVARLPIYVKRLQHGLINKNPNIQIVSESRNTALVDADNGLGQVAAKYAMEVCIKKAKESDVAVVGVRRTNHFGIAAYYAMMALKEDLIGFVATNASPLMAPWGGCTPVLGTNPFAVAIPAGKEVPIVLDMATSVVARGKIEVYKRKGQKIPLGWALDEEGQPTDDPDKALKGTLLPVGGPKGYGMALVMDILAGLMVGSAYNGGVGSLFKDFTKPQNIGNLMIAINIERFMPIEEFKSKVDEYIRKIKASKKAKGVTEIFVPGEIEYRTTLERKQKGIPLSDEVLRELRSLAELTSVLIDDYVE